jgi:transcriptional regulator with XRE-family HTH domain
MTDDYERHRQALGEWIRAQRKLQNLSLRQMAALAQISNPYLSQLERGLHSPSVHVLRSIARALNVSAETLLEQAGLLDPDSAEDAPDTAAAIWADPGLTAQQKEALIAVYRSYRAANHPGVKPDGA